MSQEMERFGGTSEEYEDEVMGIGVKGEGGEGDRDGDGDEEKKSCMFDADGMMIEEAIGFQQQFESQSQSKRSRPKEEKERTKLRERHRRAITARILAGLRRHGNYNLRVRADINDVIAALAREAGWVVHPDGTTYPSRSPQIAGVTRTAAALSTPGATAVMSPSSPMVQTQTPISYLGGGVSSLRRSSSVDYSSLRSSSVPPVSSLYNFASSTPLSGSLAVMGSRGGRAEDSPLISNCCIETVDEDNQVIEMPPRVPERDFAGTPHVPVYVMLPLGIINMKCELVDPDGLRQQLKVLKSINVDGVMVDCWWGIVEAHTPQEYNWSGYKCLFQIIRELKMKLQVVMSFHECGGNVGDDVCIPLPHWIAEIGRNNPNIFFTDREGNHNYECLTWGIDKERVLRGRTAVEVYFDYMRSFRVEFDEFFVDGIISEIEVGLGPCGELRYPSYPVNHGWKYPGIGEFQCYDLYLMKSLKKAAEARGHSIWARGPDNAGSYNSGPHETLFFCDGGDYDSYYGRFFLNWYSQVLVDHGDRVLSLAKLAFEGTCIATKLSGIHWWYKTASHAAELTAGFYNPCNRDGYAAIASMLKKHGVALNFTCVELRTLAQHEDYPEALADPEALVWQVLNAAWDACIPVASENALPCYDREGYNKILENAKPMNDPDQRHLSAFTYLRLTSQLLETENFVEFERFVKRMHGEAVSDLQL